MSPSGFNIDSHGSEVLSSNKHRDLHGQERGKCKSVFP